MEAKFIKSEITISIEIAKVLPANHYTPVTFTMKSKNQIQNFKEFLITNGVRKHTIEGLNITINNSFRAIGNIYKGLGFKDWDYIQSTYEVGHTKFYKTRSSDDYRFILFNSKTKEIKMSVTSPFRVVGNTIQRGQGSNAHWLAKKIN